MNKTMPLIFLTMVAMLFFTPVIRAQENLPATQACEQQKPPELQSNFDKPNPIEDNTQGILNYWEGRYITMD